MANTVIYLPEDPRYKVINQGLGYGLEAFGKAFADSSKREQENRLAKELLKEKAKLDLETDTEKMKVQYGLMDVLDEKKMARDKQLRMEVLEKEHGYSKDKAAYVAELELGNQVKLIGEKLRANKDLAGHEHYLRKDYLKEQTKAEEGLIGKRADVERSLIGERGKEQVNVAVETAKKLEPFKIAAEGRQESAERVKEANIHGYRMEQIQTEYALKKELMNDNLRKHLEVAIVNRDAKRGGDILKFNDDVQRFVVDSAGMSRDQKEVGIKGLQITAEELGVELPDIVIKSSSLWSDPFDRRGELGIVEKGKKSSPAAVQQKADQSGIVWDKK